jgi:hypothetical protein
MGRSSLLKRLIVGQINPTMNYPVKDKPSEQMYEEGKKEKITRLIKTKKFNPKKFAQSHILDIKTKNFKIGPYNIKAIRANTPNIDGGWTSFEEYSRLLKFENWQIEITDQNKNLVSNRNIIIPKNGNENTELYNQILNILNE